MALDVERSEVPNTLDEPAPRTLGVLDQGAFWGNLGVSLLGFSGALAVLAPAGVPQLSFAAAVTATVVGTVLGSLMVGIAAIPGARTGAPAMMLLRGLFGTRLSYLPTVLNILQLVGWGTFELLVIAQGAEALFGGGPQWLYVLIAGVLTTALTLRPLGALRLLRRYVSIAVLIAMVYFFVQLLLQPLPPMNDGSWEGFWPGADAALAVAVSWLPVASDYSRHSRSASGAFTAATVGYSVTQIACYLLGLLGLALVGFDGDKAFDPLLAAPLGVLFFAVLVLREVDQSFADTYSTAVSIQNLRPSTDRRLLSLIVGVVSTLAALTMDIEQFSNFLLLIGSVFVPMFGVLAVDYFYNARNREWDVSAQAPSRWGMLIAWLLGFAAFQLINPGELGWWTALWTGAREAIGFTVPTWMSAALTSFVISAVAAGIIGLLARSRRKG
ncbi:purine-cytosine permease family protein [Saccharopolyspora endophytica]|uniref:Cytosine permease n=1 Tax=Saccharopolyspora endophytica TaxID=543886 RepID=A0ABS5DPB7_9PSEU|nr:cytosine permease [Saccharopolyspora endophytica]MBQ0928141.1 cytosine permease [Saccharopolyspora endophytica]